MNMQTSVKANSVPAGGSSSTVQNLAGRPQIMDDITAQRVFAGLGTKSLKNCAPLNVLTLQPGQQVAAQITNVGLCTDIDLFTKGQITIVNTSGADKTFTIAYDAPFAFLSNVNFEFNGQTTVLNASAYELNTLAATRSKGFIPEPVVPAGSSFAQNLIRIGASKAYIKAISGCTLATGNSITGSGSVTVTSGSTGILEVGFRTNCPFVYRQDLPYGMLPMQNNAIFLSMKLSSPTTIGATAASPLFIAGGLPAGVTVTTALNVYPTYNFWQIPVNPKDAQYYLPFVANNYIIASQGNNSLSATGKEAFQYNLSTNYYLLKLIATFRDSTGALLDTYANLDNPYMFYNNTARVGRCSMLTKFDRDMDFYEGAPGALGQLIWDGTNSGMYQSNSLNSAGWVDMYDANNPQWIADVASTVSLNVTYSVLRETLVPNKVAVV